MSKSLRHTPLELPLSDVHTMAVNPSKQSRRADATKAGPAPPPMATIRPATAALPDEIIGL